MREKLATPEEELTYEQMQAEIQGSKADLENVLHIPTTTFAYPYGEFDADVQSVTRGAGFQCAHSAMSGLNIVATPLFTLHRVEIEGTFKLPRFLLALWLGCTS